MNIAQADRNKESFISSFPEIRPEIAEYVIDEIIPRYAAFDPAHREDHAWDVIENSMNLYRRAPEEVRGVLDPEIIFVAAACHDLGRINVYDKYGPGGYLKLWIPWSDNASRLECLRMLLDDREAARKEVERLYHETAGGPAAGI